MVAADGGLPVSRTGAQTVQETSSVSGIGSGVECLGERAERIRVVMQIDLHAAHVDQLYLAGAQFLGRGHGLLPRVKDHRHALSVDGPRPRDSGG